MPGGLYNFFFGGVKIEVRTTEVVQRKICQWGEVLELF